MKHMSTSLGFDYEPENSLVPVDDKPTYVEASGEPGAPIEAFNEGNATNYDDLNEIIHKTKHYGLSLLESVEGFEPHNRPRVYEVAGQMINTTLAAIKTKHAYEAKMRDYARKTVTPPAVTNTQNNYFGTREEVIKMMKQLKDEG